MGLVVVVVVVVVEWGWRPLFFSFLFFLRFLFLHGAIALVDTQIDIYLLV